MTRTSNGVSLGTNAGYWRARWTDHTGRRKAKNLGRIDELSKTQAKRLCVELAAQHIAAPGTRSAGAAPSMEAWRDRYFTLRAGEIKGGTETLHRQTFARLIAKFGPGCKLDRITKAMAAEFRVWLMDQTDQRIKGGKLKIGSQSVARHIRDCKVIFGRAVELDILATNPFAAVRAGAVSVAKEWRQVTRADLDRIMNVCPSVSWELAFAIARLAGLRRGEILRLVWNDIDLAHGTIRVMPEENTEGLRVDGTKQRARMVPVSQDLSRILRRFSGALAGTDHVCRIPTENIHRQAGAILERAGVGRYSKPFHTLKKCLASEWLAAGHAVSDVAQWLGDSVEVLMKHYARSLQSSADKVTGKRDEMTELRQRLAQLEAENAKLKGGAA